VTEPSRLVESGDAVSARPVSMTTGSWPAAHLGREPAVGDGLDRARCGHHRSAGVRRLRRRALPLEAPAFQKSRLLRVGNPWMSSWRFTFFAELGRGDRLRVSVT